MTGPDRELSAAQASAMRLLGPLDGQEIPGGCDHCEALQVVRPVEAGIFAITVKHDEWCPVLRRQQGGRA